MTDSEHNVPFFCYGSPRKTLQDQVRNEVIKENVMVRKTTDQRVDEKRLTWCGHVRRTEITDYNARHRNGANKEDHDEFGMKM